MALSSCTTSAAPPEWRVKALRSAAADQPAAQGQSTQGRAEGAAAADQGLPAARGDYLRGCGHRQAVRHHRRLHHPSRRENRCPLLRPFRHARRDHVAGRRRRLNVICRQPRAARRLFIPRPYRALARAARLRLEAGHELGEGSAGAPRAGAAIIAGNLREALIQAALDLIAEKGPGGFSFAEAARAAGVSAGRSLSPFPR